MIELLLEQYNLFCNRINEIKDYISLLNMQNELICSKENSSLNNYINNLQQKKCDTVTYNAIIISIYGCFENFIDDILAEYLKKVLLLSKNYSKLNNNICNKYKKEVTDYINNQNHFCNYNLELNNVVRHFYECINKDNCINIDVELIIKHPGNLKINQINNLLRECGIDNSISKIKENQEFIEYIKQENDLISDDVAKEYLNKLDNNYIFSKLDRLVDLRNSVSHSWNSDDRDSIQVINDSYIKFMNIFCKCIYELLFIELYILMKETDNMVEIEIKELYSDTIIEVDTKDYMFSVGDYILFVNGNGKYNLTKVKGMKNKESKDIPDCNNEDRVTIQLTKKMKKSYKLYIKYEK